MRPQPRTCPHDIVQRDVAVTADGYCPLCQAAEIARLQERLGQAEARIATDERLAADNNKLRAALEEAKRKLRNHFCDDGEWDHSGAMLVVKEIEAALMHDCR